MPRIYNSLSDPLDFCNVCFPETEEEAREDYDTNEEGPDNRGNCFEYNADHPPYSDTDYQCECCGKDLTDEDNKKG